MKQRPKNRSPIALISVVLIASLSGILAQPSSAYTPESPKVQAMCAKAVKFLEGMPKGETYGGRLGGECLVSLAIHKFYKNQGLYTNKLHPIVQATLLRCRKDAPNLSKMESNRTYSIGIALIFLSEVSPASDYGTIQVYVNHLLAIQMRNGPWGYVRGGSTTGDISQNQYGVLGLWSAANVGINVGAAPMERCAMFLLRVQDPKGGWGYQAEDPGPGNPRRVQPEVTASRVAAGLGSLYVAADYLGFSKATDGDDKDKDSLMYIDIPPVFIPVIEEDKDNPAKRKKRKRIRYKSRIPFPPIQKAFDEGNAWLEKDFKYKIGGWQYYYFYALERCYSFREFMEGTFVKEPNWYNGGVDFLGNNQTQEGWFKVGGGVTEDCGKYVDTAFVVLFLLRSTRDTIQRVANSSGAMRGGYGLPDDVSDVRLTSDNKIQAPKVTVAMADIMKMLEGDEEAAKRFDDIVSNPDAYAISDMDPKKSKEFTERMRRVLRSGSWQARIMAARLLGRQGDLDNVPILIYALTDPDPRVVKGAYDGLRLSRRQLFNVGTQPDPRDPDSVRSSVTEWKTWFRSIRPDAAFIEPGSAISPGGRKTTDDNATSSE